MKKMLKKHFNIRFHYIKITQSKATCAYENVRNLLM